MLVIVFSCATPIGEPDPVALIDPGGAPAVGQAGIPSPEPVEEPDEQDTTVVPPSEAVEPPAVEPIANDQEEPAGKKSEVPIKDEPSEPSRPPVEDPPEEPSRVPEPAVAATAEPDETTPEPRQVEPENSEGDEKDPEEQEASPIVVFDSGAVAMAEPADPGKDVHVVSVPHPEPPPPPPVPPPPAPPPPPPQPLDGGRINALIHEKLGEKLTPVTRSGSAMYLLHDLDGNGYNDVFALAVRASDIETVDYDVVHDFTRLYSKSSEVFHFYLRLFYQKKGTLVPAELVSLGKRFVLDSFLPQAIVKDATDPFAASVVFTTPQGRVREWVIFSSSDPVRFTMHERSGELPQIEDINSDGTIDIVMYEEGFEAGIGNETYLTWYRWDGVNFSRHLTVNVVRNLRSFLRESFSLVDRGDWTGFSKYCLSPEMRKKTDSIEGFGVFERVFRPAPADDSYKNEPIIEDDTVRKAVYPEIRENPLHQRDESGFFFPLTIRFETVGGRTHLYTARIYMQINPFSEPQFTFGVTAE